MPWPIKSLVVALLSALTAPLAAQRFAGRVLDVTAGDTVMASRGRGGAVVDHEGLFSRGLHGRRSSVSGGPKKFGRSRRPRGPNHPQIGGVL